MMIGGGIHYARRVNKDTADRGGFYTLQDKRKSSRKPTSRDRVLLKRVSQHRPEFTGKHVRARDKHHQIRSARSIERASGARQRGRLSVCDDARGERKPDRIVRD